MSNLDKLQALSFSEFLMLGVSVLTLPIVSVLLKNITKIKIMAILLSFHHRLDIGVYLNLQVTLHLKLL